VPLQGKSASQVAKELGIHRSIVTMELKRGAVTPTFAKGPRGYKRYYFTPQDIEQLKKSAEQEEGSQGPLASASWVAQILGMNRTLFARLIRDKIVYPTKSTKCPKGGTRHWFDANVVRTLKLQQESMREQGVISGWEIARGTGASYQVIYRVLKNTGMRVPLGYLLQTKGHPAYGVMTVFYRKEALDIVKEAQREHKWPK
jgi:hypothetical protein